MSEVGIVGATSGLGAAIGKALLARGSSVRAGHRAGRALSRSLAAATAVQAELEDVGLVVAFAGCQTVVWAAHDRRVGVDEVRANVEPFARFVEHAAMNGIERIVLISSGGAVYGQARTIPIAEDHLCAPVSAYGRAKLTMEHLLERSDVSAAVLRPANVYGGDADSCCRGVITAFLLCALEGTPARIIGSPFAVRDYLHVDDFARAALHAIDDPRRTVWNVGSGIGRSVEAVHSTILATIAPRQLSFAPGAADFGAIFANVLSSARIRSETGWAPEVEFDDGVRRFARNLS